MQIKKYKNKAIALLGLLLLFLVSYIRQSLFLVVNAVIAGKKYNYSNYTPPTWLVKDFTPHQLMFFKWPLTLFFICAIGALTIFFLHLIFHDKKLNKFIAFAFIVITVIAFILYIIAKASTQWSAWYFWTHQLMMLCQSPLIYMFCLPTVWYMKKNYRQ